MASVTKRGKYWRAQVRRLGYPPQHKTFDTNVDAEAWARVVESEMDRGVFASRVEAERTTLAEALKRYKTEICSRKAHPVLEYQHVDRWLRELLTPELRPPPSPYCRLRPAAPLWLRWAQVMTTRRPTDSRARLARV